MLDDPVGPDVWGGQIDQVLGPWEAEVALLHVGQDGLFPVHVDGRQVDAPHDDALIVGDWAGSADVDGEGRGLRVEKGGVYSGGDVRYERGGFAAAGRLSSSILAGWVDRRRARVAENGRGAVIVDVGATATCCGYGAEPVIVDGLIGFDDYIVTLADAEKEPISFNGIDRDEV